MTEEEMTLLNQPATVGDIQEVVTKLDQLQKEIDLIALWVKGGQGDRL